MKSKTTFTPPEGYQVPEGTADGSTFDESVTLKMEGKKLCIVAINGVSMPGYEEDAEKGSKSSPDPVEGDFAARYKAAMAAGGSETEA